MVGCCSRVERFTRSHLNPSIGPSTPTVGRTSLAQSQVVTPLLRDGVPIGTLLVHRRARRAFTEQQIRLLETFADQAVIAIENAPVRGVGAADI